MIIVSDKEFPWYEGLTVSKLLDALDDPYPYAVVRINGKHVSKPDFDRYLIPDESEVFLLPLIAGG